MRLAVLPLLAVLGCGSTASSPPPGTDAGHPDSGKDAGRRETGGQDSGARESGGGDTGGGGDAEEAGKPRVAVAYASGYEPNILWFGFNAGTGALSPAGMVASFGSSPSFLVGDAAGTHLYAVDENTPGQVGAYAIDGTTGALTFQNAVSSGGSGPPFVALDGTGKWLFVANYGDGSASVLPVQGDGSLGAAVVTLSAGTEAHMMIADPSNRFVFIACKGVDYVAQYLFDDKTGQLTPNVTPRVMTAAGAGPRHLAFHPNGKWVYLINETASTLGLYAFDAGTGTLSEIKTISSLPGAFSGTNTAAEVHVHPSGQWVLASNRGADDLGVFAVDPKTGELTPTTFTASGGTTPRDFSLDPSGRFVYAANQGTGNVVPFAFDVATGALTPNGAAIGLTMASFVGLVELPLAGP